MNKHEAIKQAEKLREELDKLQEIINAPDKVTYDDVVDRLKPSFWISGFDGGVRIFSGMSGYCYPSREIAEREVIRIKWINIAEYVNEGWNPDWNDSKQEKHCIYYNYKTKEIGFDYYHYIHCDGAICFKSKEAAKQALEILGEDEFKKMLG